MAIDQKSGFVGLITNAGRLNAPPGSLEVADNVVIRKPGVIEPRPGVTDLTLGWSPPTSSVKKLWEYDGHPYAYTSAGWFRVYSSTELQLTNTAGTVIDPSLYRADMIPVASSRGNLYSGTQKGVLKLVGYTDSTFDECGMPAVLAPYLVASSTGSPTAVATGYKVAYRLVVKRTDSNGVVVRSVPTGALIYSNTSGATRDVNVLALTSSLYSGTFLLAATDEIEIYRTRAFPTASTIDEEYAYVGLATTTAYFKDTLTDAQRGAALYTSPSQGGATAENQRPPACGCIETYKGHVFYGNTVSPHRKIVSFNVSTADLAGSATGIGFRAISGTATISTNTITAMANTTGLKAGMVVSLYTGASVRVFSQNTYIVSVDSAAQVTVSSSAASTYTGTANYLDAVQVDGEWHPVFSASALGVYSSLSPMSTGIGGYTDGSNLANLPSYTYHARNVTPATPPYANTVIIEELTRSSRSAANHTIRATHGSEYSPALPEYGATALDMDRDVFKNGVLWSKRDEPEHVPPLNYALVGDKKKDLVGLVSTKDSLFILKDDGIWRLSGPGGNGFNAWRIDPFDLTTFCVLPQSIQKLNGKIYFLSNKGIVRLSDSGVELVSQAINNEVKLAAYYAQGFFNLNEYYSLGSVSDGPYWSSAVNEVDNEYMLTIGTSGAASGTTAKTLSGTLIFNEATGAWTTMSLQTTGAYAFANAFPLALGWSPSERSVLLGTTDVYGWVRKLTTPGTDSPLVTGYDARDDGYSNVTITTVTGSANSYTVTYTAAHLLRAGDIVVDSAGLVFVVTSVTSSTIVVVAGRVNGTTYTAPSTGGGYVASTGRATVRARAFVLPAVAHKLWAWVKASFAEIRGSTTLNVTTLSNASGASSNASAQQSVLASVPYYHGMSASYRGTDLKANVPRSDARSRDMWSGVEVYTGLGNWQLDAFSVGVVESEPGKPPTANDGAA